MDDSNSNPFIIIIIYLLQFLKGGYEILQKGQRKLITKAKRGKKTKSMDDSNSNPFLFIYYTPPQGRLWNYFTKVN